MAVELSTVLAMSSQRRWFTVFRGFSPVAMELIPSSDLLGTESLMQGSHAPVPVKITNHKFIQHWEEPTITERMDLELHDYPPSGANGRHTPRSPYP
ncbi:hypothetical protein TanjilG_32658 [Lupinus angustifolius]|uniref:Uncharacterized protein n=1 Tax=Lupinus angustifolius TaxID=3871 RepID=A0A1J7IRP5_LUPAN|nr:hypothetical protein TanjilG_32658 [Lupinus angustifolius]